MAANPDWAFRETPARAPSGTNLPKRPWCWRSQNNDLDQSHGMGM
jgi:hypothetical protein